MKIGPMCSIRRVFSSILPFLWLALPFFAESSPHAKYSWQKIMSRGPVELYRIEIDRSGKGKFEFRRRGDESILADFNLRPRALASLDELFQKADFFNTSKDFVSPRKVADTGMKTLGLEEGDKKREVSFNYTEDRFLWQVVEYYENLCQQERSLFELELALKFDKLGIPKRLEILDKDLNSRRIIAPERFTPLLQKIYNDSSLMNIARVEAHRLLASIQKKQ